MKATYIIGGLIALGLIAGAVYFFGKSSKDEVATTTTTNQSQNTGISGLLAGLNFSGLSLF